MNGKSKRDIGRAISMADAAPMLSTTPRGSSSLSMPGSAFEEGGGGFDSSYGKSSTGAGVGSSSISRKPGRCGARVRASTCMHPRKSGPFLVVYTDG